ncbi:MAG TPA: M48 family metallopeptidase [Actinomycetota bacterium]|nr:M48 family metallopeptidase [Actinomycetota bacterium]
MYEQIAANKWRSALLIIGFIIVVSGTGWLFGEASGAGPFGLVLAVLVSTAIAWTSYWYSDRIVLKMSKARPANLTEHARLVNIVEGLSIAGGIPVPRVYVVDDAAPNAFATGRDPEHAAIAVTTGLIEKMNRVELEGVIAHEMAHIMNRDILVSTIAVVLAGVVTLLSDWMLRGFWRIGGRGRRELGLMIGLIGLVVAIIAPIVAQLMKLAISRKRESLADASGVKLTRYPPGLIAALKKLQGDSTVVRTSSRATAHLWIESPLDRQGGGAASWLNRLFNTHPPIEERIRELEEL